MYVRPCLSLSSKNKTIIKSFVVKNSLSVNVAKMPTNCVFCKIAKKIERTEILYEDDEVMIFNDIRPAAANHILVIPKIHIRDPKRLLPEHKRLVEKLVDVGERLFEEKGLNAADTLKGFHWPPFNSVNHLHLHLINPASQMTVLSRTIFKPNSFWFVTSDYLLARLSSRDCRL